MADLKNQPPVNELKTLRHQPPVNELKTLRQLTVEECANDAPTFAALISEIEAFTAARARAQAALKNQKVAQATEGKKNG